MARFFARPDATRPKLQVILEDLSVRDLFVADGVPQALCGRAPGGAFAHEIHGLHQVLRRVRHLDVLCQEPGKNIFLGMGL